MAIMSMIDDAFQSTRPHGARPAAPGVFHRVFSFNPRARMGRDHFIAPIIQTLKCFNPRARMGRDKDGESKSCGCYRFNPRARMGRDRPPVDFSKQGEGFQSTRPHGARLAVAAQGTICIVVSIHAPAWGATRRDGST